MGIYHVAGVVRDVQDLRMAIDSGRTGTKL